MRFRTLDELVAQAESLEPSHMAVAAAHDPEVLQSVDEAQRRGIATADLIGDAQQIEAIAEKYDLDLLGVIIDDQVDPHRAAEQAVSLVRDGKANIVVKGRLKTADFMRAVLDPQVGIREKMLLSHVGLFEVPGLDRLLLISDGGMVLSPTIEQKLAIIQNAVDAAHDLQLEEPRVAVLAASERIHPARPAGIEALAVARMAQEGWVHGALVDGPLPLDVAVDPDRARDRNIAGPVAGRADILIVPNVEAGSIAVKALLYVGKARTAGIVAGARVPIVVNSHADDARTRLRSFAMASLIAR